MATTRLIATATLCLVLVACAPAAPGSPQPTGTPAAPTGTPGAAPTGTPATAPTGTPAMTQAPSPTTPPATTTPAATPPDLALVCGPVAEMPLKNAGVLTIGTDNPAFPPYFEGREEGNTEPWDPAWGDPTTGRGFESAVAYAVAAEMGFAAEAVEWTVVPFNNSYAPGPKDFDFNINQVAITIEREQAVDFSVPYYFANQAVVVAEDGPFAGATTVSELRSARLGAQVGTTSYAAIETVIQPTAEISVFDSNDLAIQALSEVEPPQIDGIVVDLPTAFFIVNVQTEGLTVIGQLGPESGALPEAWGLVMEQGSPLNLCVSAAVTKLHLDGTLAQLVETWLPDRTVPVLQP